MAHPGAAGSALPAKPRREIAERGPRVTVSNANAYEPTMVVRPASSAKRAYLQLLDGPGVGERIELTKVVTAIGTPGDCVVTCIRRLDEFAVRFTEGGNAARLNGTLLTETPVLLKRGDVLEVGRSLFQFGFRAA